MKKNLINLLIVFSVAFLRVSAFSQTIKLVSPGSLSGWKTEQVFADPTMPLNKKPAVAGDVKYIRMVCGPTNPRTDLNLQNGSFYLNLTTEDNTPTNVLRRVRLNTTEQDGTFLKNLTKLLYSTYVTHNNKSSAPLLTLLVDDNGDGKPEFNINMEPKYQSPVLLNQWQEWNALDGKWWVLDPTLTDATGKQSVPIDPITENVISISDIKDHLISLSDYLKIKTGKHKDAKISGDGIRFTVGGSSDFDNFEGYVDAFTIQKTGETEFTTYDFTLSTGHFETKQTGCKGRIDQIGIPQIPGNTYSWTKSNHKPGFIQDPMTETTATITISPNENTWYTVTEKSATGMPECIFKTTIEVEVYEGVCFGGTTPFNWWYAILGFIGIPVIVAAWYIYRRVQRRRNGGK